MKRLTIAITMGDPSGIGPEVILKSFKSSDLWKRGTPLVVGDYEVMRSVRHRLSIDVVVKKVQNSEELKDERGIVPVLDQGVIKDAALLQVGKVSPSGGRAAVSYIQKAVDLALDGTVMGVATAPINKESLNEAAVHYRGHTEMLSEMSNKKKSVTMFMVDRLKIFFHSRHLPIKEAIETLTVEGVVESIELADRCLRSIGYEDSRLALAALNPHASDSGLFGDEEENILIPACTIARDRGIDVMGPIPADSVFHFALQGRYDAVISLYHDQGHIASKTYDFHRTVSVTFGLPFIRTSVDHGTAFDIAWKGIASSTSMEEAILLCFDLAGRYKPV